MPYTMKEVMEAMEDDSTKSVIGNMTFGDKTYGFSAYKVVGNVVRVDVFRDDEGAN